MAHLTEADRHLAYLNAQAQAYECTLNGETSLANMWARVAQALRKDRV